LSRVRCRPVAERISRGPEAARTRNPRAQRERHHRPQQQRSQRSGRPTHVYVSCLAHIRQRRVVLTPIVCLLHGRGNPIIVTTPAGASLLLRRKNSIQGRNPRRFRHIFPNRPIALHPLPAR
jgi:hypothetical protein